MKKEHLYRGSWIISDELENKILNLETQITKDLSIKLNPAILIKAAGRLRLKLLNNSDIDLIDSLISSGQTKEKASQTISVIADFLNPDNLKKKYIRELGSLEPNTLKRINFKSNVFEAWNPLGILVHIVPGNAATVAPLSVIEGLMSGNINILKNSSKNGNFPQLLLKALIDEDATNTLKSFIYAFQISSKQTKLIEKIIGISNGVAAWGGEESVAAVQKIAPPSVRIIDWGHKISFGYVTNSMAHDIMALEAIAYDICVIEQQACSSPQCLYLETNNRNELVEFSKQFAKILEKVSSKYPQDKPSILEAAEISTITQVAKTGEALNEGIVIESEKSTWRILVDYRSSLSPSPLYRTIWIKPLPKNKIISVLEPFRTYLQTVGLACNRNELNEFSDKLIQAGVTRIMPPGKMLDGYAGQPHDGVYALQRYSRRVSMDTGNLADGISNFAELNEQDNIELDKTHSITTKEDFLNHNIPDIDAELFFKSGGTTGKAKKAVYTYNDYNIQMKSAAEALFAAGLDPKTDRCANLFYSGHMYGGFISFWSILEFLQAKQFPITAIPELDELTESIIENKIDTILGMPFYLSQLFEHSFDKLYKYGGLKKVFYGGEHWPKNQFQKYKDSFGIEIFKSAIYGSNDAGPMGYACEYCEGSVHHVLNQTQFLEIIQLDSNKPVDIGETGRLIFTSKYRSGQELARYEIGDLGRWLSGDCKCGRKSPRFELLGRFGDIFKMGPLFNYNEFLNILQDKHNYNGNLQIELNNTGKKAQSITLFIDKKYVII